MGLSFQISWRRHGSLGATEHNGLVDSVCSHNSRSTSSSLVGSARSPRGPFIGSITSPSCLGWSWSLRSMFSARAPRDTSRWCSRCGHVEKRNRVSQSGFICRVCGYESNADFNAARNIQRRADVDQPIAVCLRVLEFELQAHHFSGG